ncbi:CoA ester lyase [Alphaproteobacteria bacterium]|jgi:citrate lyase subunit beta/citryl-CoA lyase|nr:CoA ester lyase [Alphaproteobacteria bacterium]
MNDPITYLFVPADRPDRYEKALTSGADRIIIDLEDAVRPDNKMVARDAIAAATLDWQNVIIRINAVDSVHFEFDMSLLRNVPVPKVMIAKAESAHMVTKVDDALDRKCQLLPQIETVKSLFALGDILHAKRVDRLAFGHLDFALDLGSGSDDNALLYARSQIVMHSRYAGKPAPIDSVTVDFRDAKAAQADAASAKNLGFGGKLIIHPAQEKPVKKGFAPSPTDIAWAETILQIVEKGGRGALAADGSMIDKPVEIRARHILDRAKAIR